MLGPPIADYLAGRGLRPRAKTVALATLWASVLLSVLAFVPLLAADPLLCVAAAVTAYILRLPTCQAAGDGRRRALKSATIVCPGRPRGR